ncbi:glutamate receptor 2.5-like [Benincasa hispida]|uniref:glutamate receptor 2.5-like n=1 Tax=Benincasa hispida TaxID=102211 RepID=UPI0019001993|nr:glutamate receptor 2.5-like [Benincasa hispida]
MFGKLWFLCFLGFLLLDGSSSVKDGKFGCSSDDPKTVLNIGVIADNSSRVGREQIIAIQMAVKDYIFTSCYKMELLLVDSPQNSAQATATSLDLISNKEVKAMFGTLTMEEVSLIFELNKTSMNVPIISLSLSSLVPPPWPPNQLLPPTFIQMSNDITHEMQCITSTIGNFHWRRVSVIYEQKNGFSTNMAILNLLSNSLEDVYAKIENHLPFSLLDPEPLIEQKLMNLSTNSNRVFVLVQSSTELATLLFKKAKKLNMMANGYVWIVGGEIANLVDSLYSSTFTNLQGVIGCKVYFEENENSFKEFRTKFRRNYMSNFPEDEGQGDPSIYALRAYDAYWAIATVLDELKGNPNGMIEQWPKKVLRSKIEGLSGIVSFKNCILSTLPTFQIINVIGRSYKQIAFWSPKFGFFEGNNTSSRNATMDLSTSVIWPGNAKTIPKGWEFSYGDKALKIGVPTTAAFKEFVRVNYNHTDGPHISGFSIAVFQAVATNLPYFLPYNFIPFDGPYDDLLKKVYTKDFDGAVGDFGIFADRLKYVDFSEPYLDNAAVMIVKEKPLKWTKLWLFMKAFTAKMWVIMLSMHVFVSSSIWLIERKHNDALKGVGNMLWFSVSVIFYVHREPVKNGLARMVLGPWLFAILIITASFTASLSSMMTLSRSQPWFLDIETLRLKNATVGCNKNSVMVRFLSQVLLLPPEKIKQIPSVDLFPHALEKGEIQAAFFSGPHAKVFLAKHCKYYTQATIFKLVGMGFAFPKGSPLTVDISASIAELIERREMPDLESTLLSTFNCSLNDNDPDGSGLGPEPFAGLFLIAGAIAFGALLFTAARLILMKLGWIKQQPATSKAQSPI